MEDGLGGINLDLCFRIPDCFPNLTHVAAPEAFAPLIEVQLVSSRGKVTEYLSGTSYNYVTSGPSKYCLQACSAYKSMMMAVQISGFGY